MAPFSLSEKASCKLPSHSSISLRICWSTGTSDEKIERRPKTISLLLCINIRSNMMCWLRGSMPVPIHISAINLLLIVVVSSWLGCIVY